MKERAWEAGVESLMQTQRHKNSEYMEGKKQARRREEGREERVTRKRE